MAASPRSKTRHPVPRMFYQELETATRRVGFGLLIIASAVTVGLGVVVLFPVTEQAMETIPLGLPLLVVALLLTVLTSGLYTQLRLRQMGEQRISFFLDRDMQLRRFRRLYERMVKLDAACRTLASRSDPGAVYKRVTQIIYDGVESERVSLMVLDPISGELEVRAAVGHGDMDLVLGAREAVGDGIAGWVAEHRKPLLLGHEVDLKKFWAHKPQKGVRSAMAVPIVLSGEVLGVLCASTSLEPEYDQEDLKALQLVAWHAAVQLKVIRTAASRSQGRKKRKAA